MLSAKGLAIGRDGRVLLRFTDFALHAKEQCLVSGKSGCGKSTLLLTLAGMIAPMKGDIVIDGKTINNLPESERDAYRGTHIGIVFQSLHLMPFLSVQDNLKLAFYSAGLPVKEDRVEKVLEKLELSKFKNRMPHTLSQGQAQRVSIGRAVVHSPKLILADEPTSSLDDENCERVMALIQELAVDAGSALIVSTHDNRIAGRFERRLMLHGADA